MKYLWKAAAVGFLVIVLFCGWAYTNTDMKVAGPLSLGAAWGFIASLFEVYQPKG